VRLKTDECKSAAITAVFMMSLEYEVRDTEVLESAFEKHRQNINVDNGR
jgi:hypothetical protein